jgi:hypothetical protein
VIPVAESTIPKSPEVVENVTVTKVWAETADFIAQKNGRVVTVNGYIYLRGPEIYPKSGESNQKVLFTLGNAPSRAIIVCDNTGLQYDISTTGRVYFHETTTIQTATFRFFSFSYCS